MSKPLAATGLAVLLAFPFGIYANENTSESLSKATQEVLLDEAIQSLAPNLNVAEKATEKEASSTDEDAVFPSESDSHTVNQSISSETDSTSDGKQPWYRRLQDYLLSKKEETVARGKAYLERRKMEVKYGDGAGEEPSIEVLREAEEALKQAEEIKIQRELALIVAQQEAKELYEESLMCLALNGYYEARGETADQEVATGAVVLNRLSVGFRDATTICEVIMTPAQFSWVQTHGLAVPNFSNDQEKKAWQRSLLIAKRLMEPDATYIDPTNGAVYYYNPSIVDWKYAPHYVETAILGQHRFMREKKGHPYYINNNVVRINPVLFNGLTKKEREDLIANYELN